MRGGRGCQTVESAPIIRVVVNGEQREVSAGLSLAGLLRTLGLEPSRLAVERNRKIVRREAWAETLVVDGDRLEIVQFVGGG
jgi:thiamine biosynthesis protein ThiS